MRIRMVSALCVFLPLIYSPRPAAAQFNSSLPPMPQAFARKLPSPGKLSELQTSAGYRGVGTDAELRRRLRSLLQRRGGEQRPEADAMGIRSPFFTRRTEASTQNILHEMQRPQAYNAGGTPGGGINRIDLDHAPAAPHGMNTAAIGSAANSVNLK